MPAHAQYIWLDDKGLKQLSDQPPPPSVPPNRILKQPRQAGVAVLVAPAAPADGAAPASAPAAAAPAKAPPTVAERNADFNKRRAAVQAAEQKAGEEAVQRERVAEGCANARNFQRSLDEGMRIGSYDENGQRKILNDAERAEAAKRNQRNLARCPA